MTTASEDLWEPTLGQLLGHVSRLVSRRRRMKLASIGLHHAQGMILSQLWHDDGLSQLELARALSIRPPTATKTLQRMERDGWIVRRRDETDQRIVRVYMTEKARSLHEELRDLFRALDRELAPALTARERESLRQLLLKVHQYLSATAEGGPGCCAGPLPDAGKVRR